MSSCAHSPWRPTLSEVTATNLRTGEHILLHVDRPVIRSRVRVEDPFVLLFHEGLDVLSDAELTITEYRVFFLVLRRARTEPWHSEPTKMAKTLGIDSRRVSRALARLEALGLIERPERGMLRLNPNIAWRGSAAARKAALEEKETA